MNTQSVYVELDFYCCLANEVIPMLDQPGLRRQVIFIFLPWLPPVQGHTIILLFLVCNVVSMGTCGVKFTR